MKSGYKTSEFHLTLITVGAGFALSRLGVSDECKNEIVTNVVPMIAAAVASAGYAISRAITKLRAPAAPPAPPASPAP